MDGSKSLHRDHNLIITVVKFCPFLNAYLHMSASFLTSSQRESIMRPCLVSTFLSETKVSSLAIYFLQHASAFILFTVIPNFLCSVYFAQGVDQLWTGPTGSNGCASKIKIFASSPAFIQLSRQKGAVLTIPQVPECVKGNSKRVTE